jgi:putative drug exporter of the RND superfamily
LAALVIRCRWWLLVGWIVFIALVQDTAGGPGGATYEDSLSLPRTESAAVATALKDAGLDIRTG